MPARSQQERVAYRMSVWENWFDPTIVAIEGWHTGWCPLHDRSRMQDSSAEYNFRNGTFRCMNTPRCHNLRGISLTTLANQMVGLW